VLLEFARTVTCYRLIGISGTGDCRMLKQRGLHKRSRYMGHCCASCNV